jgi:tetratricopeptide (TPR) repeat protein
MNNSQEAASKYLDLGNLAKKESKYPEAISFYVRAIEIDHNCYEAYIELENIPTSQYQFNSLVTFYQKIIEQNLDLPFTWGNLADIFTAQGEQEEAIHCYKKACYKKAIQKNPKLASSDWNKNKKNSPDFIVIGAPRCGTTSLYVYLQQHPQFLSPTKKEIHFFTYHFQKGIDWYLAHFPCLADGQEFFTGEATATYLYDLNAAQRIAQTFPKVKLIVLLRNPVDRAASWHHYKVKIGMETRTLDQALEDDIRELETITLEQRYNSNLVISNNLLGGFYIDYLQEWIKIFSKKQFLIIESENFYENTEKVMCEVFNFLELPNHPGNKQKLYAHFNAADYEKISKNTRDRIDKIFLDSNNELEQLLGKKLNWNTIYMRDNQEANIQKIEQVQKYIEQGELL